MSFKKRLIICLAISTLFFLTLSTSPLMAGTPGSSQSAFTTLAADVSQAGSSTVGVNIDVPSGIGGIQPSVSVGYNSNTPNSVLGVGWSLELGSIQRTTALKGVPTYNDATDTFELMQNGSAEKLVPVPGQPGVYMPEFEGAFMKIEFINSAYWKVTDKKGIVYTFGETSNSREFDPANTGHIFKWALSKVSDLNGNTMVVTYSDDGNSTNTNNLNNSVIYPQDIAYTSNPSQNLNAFAHVTFEYENRNDVLQSNISGFARRTMKRLSNIRVLADNNLQRRYHFNYHYSQASQRSMLESVVQFGADDTTAYPASTFTYQNDNSNPNVTYTQSTVPPVGMGDNTWKYIKSGGWDCGDNTGLSISPPGYAPASQPYSGNCMNSSGPTNPFYWEPTVFTATTSNGGLDMTSTGAGALNQDRAYWFWTFVYSPVAQSVLIDTDRNGGQVGIWINGTYAGLYDQFVNLQPGLNQIDITAFDQTQGFWLTINFAQNSSPITILSGDKIAPLVGDFNGDGLIDRAVFNKLNNHFDVAMNNGNGFDPETTWISNVASHKKIVGGDFNGDGKTDLVIYDGTYGNWEVNFSTGTAFTTNSLPNWISGYGGPSETPGIGDFDGDGKADIYSIYTNNGQSTARIALNTGSAFVNMGNTPDVVVGSPGEQIIATDFNTDGLTDFLTYEPINGNWTVRLNRGNKVFDVVSSPGYAGTLADYAVNKVPQVGDFNGDGMADIGYLDSGTLHYRIFTGSGFSTTDYTLAVTFSGLLSSQGYSVLGADLNGDGSQDWLAMDFGGGIKLATASGEVSDLLTQTSNGIGGVTTFEYDPAPLSTSLPFPIQVVKSITKSDSLGHNYTSQYVYSGGLWVNGTTPGEPKEFRGFQEVKMTDPDGNYSITHYHQDFLKKGRPQWQATYDAQNNLYSKTENTWTVEQIIPGVNFIYQSRSDNYLYNGDPTGVRTAQEFFYQETPQVGNLTKSVDYGLVDLSTGADIPGDERTVETFYVNNTNNHLLGLPNQVVVKDQNNNIVRQNWFYYDGSNNLNATPTLGQLTKKEDWNGVPAGNPNNPTNTFTYNAFGNLVSTTDALGNTTTITYDPTFHIFPLTTTNAIGFQSTTEYYGVNGVPLSSGGYTGLWGQVKSSTDPNNVSGSKIYDTFGRPVAGIGPLDTLALPSATTEYTLTSTYGKVKSYKRVEHGQPQTIVGIQYFDGLGRVIQSKTKSEIPGQYIVSGQTEYNSRGLPFKKYSSYYTTNNLDTLDPIDPNKPHTTILYDAMGRMITSTNPDGTYGSLAYDDLSTTSINPNGHMQKSIYDVRGRLVKKEEYLGADGRDAANYPQSPYSLYATTVFSYDSEGSLTQVVDAHNNITTISYDTLGRKIAINDPDMGTWSYNYDHNGNLISQIDAKGQQLDFTYDALNRIQSKAENNGPLGVKYVYDDPTQSFSKGRLTEASYNADHTLFVYDLFGRELSSTKTIDRKEFAVEKDYDALSRLTRIQYPDRTNIYYGYNSVGQVNKVADQPIATPPPQVGLPSAKAQYKFNDSGSGNSILDASINHFDGTLFNATKLLLNANGTQTSSLIVDEVGHTISTFGAHLDTSIKKFGSASIAFNGTADYLSLNALDINLLGGTTGPFGGSNDQWTIDFWVKLNSWNQTQVFMGQGSASEKHWYIYQDSVNGIRFFAQNNYTTLVHTSVPASGPVKITDSNWHHIAFGKSGGNYAIYLDGVQIGTANNTTTVSITDPIEIGKYPLGNIFYVDGYLDDVRVSHTQNLSVYPVPGNSVLVPTSEAVYRETTQDNSVPGIVNNAQRFDTDQCVNINSMVNNLVTHAQGTISFWAKLDADSAGTILSFGDEQFNNTEFVISASNNGGLAIGFTGGTVNSWQSLVMPGAIPVGSWAHIAIVQDGVEPKLYINGILQSINFDLSGNLPDKTKWFSAYGVNSAASIDNGRVGCQKLHGGPDSAHFNGKLDDLRIYDQALDANGVALLYNNGVGTELENPAPAIPPQVGINYYIQDVNYNAQGQITHIVYGNGVETNMTYDPITFRLMRMTSAHGPIASNPAIQDLQYTYDAVGNIITIVDNVNTGSQTFQYDEIGRLINATGQYCAPVTGSTLPTTCSKQYAYDEIGNITLKDGLSYYYGGAGPHAVTKLSDGSYFEYDANGNMTSKYTPTEKIGYSYDAENRLTDVYKSGVLTAHYDYDGDGGRTKKTEYVLVGGTPISGISFGTQVQQIVTRYVGSIYQSSDKQQSDFIYLGSQRVAAINNGQLVYYHGDHLGSANLITNAAGTVTEITEYEPFGKFSRQDRLGTPDEVASFHFTGHRYDAESGLIYMQARYYDPSLGRFITPDTIVQSPDNSQTHNRYTYANNNPINNIDPSGHNWFKKVFGGLNDFLTNSINGLFKWLEKVTGTKWIVSIDVEVKYSTNTPIKDAANLGKAGSEFLENPGFGILGVAKGINDWIFQLARLYDLGDEQEVYSGFGYTYSFASGILNDTIENVIKAAKEVPGIRNLKNMSDALLIWNPSSGLIADLVESVLSKLFPFIGVKDRQIAGVLHEMIASGKAIHSYFHSEGSIIGTNNLFYFGLTGGRLPPGSSVDLIGTPITWIRGQVSYMVAGGEGLVNYKSDWRDPVTAFAFPNPVHLAMAIYYASQYGAKYHGVDLYYKKQ